MNGRLLMVLALCLLSCTGWAADELSQDGDRLKAQVQEQRLQIAAMRQQAEQQYEQDEVDCWQRFAVNACLKKARARRRQAMAEQRQLELQLNAQERERQTQSHLRRIEEKSRP